MYIDKSFFNQLKLDYAGFADYSRYENDILAIGGWSVLFSENNQLPSMVYVLFNNQIIGQTNVLTIDRADVQEVNGGNIPLECGFEAIIPSSYHDKLNYIEVFVESKNALYQLNRFSGFLSQVELCGKCNLRCPQCPSVIYSSFHNKELDKSSLDLMKPLFEQARSICFDGFGEALLAKELEYAFSSIPYSKDLIFHTNGMLLDRHSDMILKYSLPLRKIIVSIDSLQKDLYAVVRKDGDLDKVLKNVKELFELRNSRGQNYPKIIPNMIIMKSNFQEIKAFVDLAATLDNTLELIHLYDIDKLDVEDSTFEYENEKIKYTQKEYTESLNDALEYAKEKNVHVYFSGSVTSEENCDSTSNYIGKEKKLSECPYKDNGRCTQADGKFMFCVWQTSPVFDWKETNNVDPHQNVRALKVMEMLNNDTIPYECSGAGCQYVHGRLSDETNDDILPEKFVKGGWSAVK